MNTFNTAQEWSNYCVQNNKTSSIGFVPTMGALHKGHGSLIEKSVKENDQTVVSIFVNPTQFNNIEDLNNYPSTLSADKNYLTGLGVDYLFLPKKEDIYPDNYTYKVSENQFSKKLCGQHRPGHFDGVLTVVLKLLNIISPNKMYMGEKDYQQFVLLKNMVQAFFINTQVIPCPIIREPDGLALSSRNTRLSDAQRELAPILYQTINNDSSTEDKIKQLTSHGFQVDYCEADHGRLFVAASLGKIRLIDNVEI